MALSWFMIVFWSVHLSFVYRLQWLLKWSISPDSVRAWSSFLFAWPSFDFLGCRTFGVPLSSSGQALHPYGALYITTPQMVPMASFWLPALCSCHGYHAGFGVQIQVFSLLLLPGRDLSTEAF